MNYTSETTLVERVRKLEEELREKNLLLDEAETELAMVRGELASQPEIDDFIGGPLMVPLWIGETEYGDQSVFLVCSAGEVPSVRVINSAGESLAGRREEPLRQASALRATVDQLVLDLDGLRSQLRTGAALSPSLSKILNVLEQAAAWK